MLIDIEFVKAEHQYRRHRLSELYPKQGSRRSEFSFATKEVNRWIPDVLRIVRLEPAEHSPPIDLAAVSTGRNETAAPTSGAHPGTKPTVSGCPPCTEQQPGRTKLVPVHIAE